MNVQKKVQRERKAIFFFCSKKTKRESKERKRKKKKGRKEKSKENQEKSKGTKEEKWAANERGRPAAKEKRKKRSSCREGRRKWQSSHCAQPRATAIAVVPFRRR